MRRLASTLFAAAISVAACSNSVDTSGSGGSGGSSSSSSASSSSGTPPPKCDDPPSPAAFEVGGGETCFQRLTDGQTVPMMQGPQGGFHVWAGIGCADCGPAVIVRYGVKDPATQSWYPNAVAQLVVLEPDPDGWHQIAGLTAFLPGVVWDETTWLPKGSHVIISASWEDNAQNVLAKGEVEVVLGDIEYWSPPCDENPQTCGTPGGLPCCQFG